MEPIKKESEIGSTLAYRAPVLKTLPGNKLRYLNDKERAISIAKETNDISTDLDDATILMLEEIRRMGMKIRNCEGKELVITQENFTQFWR